MTTPLRDNYIVEIEGAPLDDTIHDSIFRVEVDTTFGMASAFTVYFHDTNGELIDNTKFDPGKAIKIKTKGQNQASEEAIFEGEITSLEPCYMIDGEGTQFIIRGYDKTHRLTKGTKHRVFKNASHSDIVSQILGEYGLQKTVESTTPVYDHVYQDNQSDRDFIEGLARINGYIFGFKDSKVLFKKPTGDGEVPVEWGTGVREFQPRINAVGLVNEVVVTGWDPVQKKEITGRASSAQTKPTAVTDSGKGVSKSQEIKASTYFVYIPDVKDPDSAGKIAQALLDNFNSGYVEAEGVAYGVTKLIAGTKLKMSSLNARFNGTYFITSARHVIDHNDYRVYFSSEGAKAHLMSDMILGAAGAYRENGNSTRWSGVVPAIVTNIQDDQDIVRVKVKYPWMDDALESHWARLASVGAAKQAGIHWLPNVNDEVLVAFENGNINRPYVLGGLWNGKDKAPYPASEAVKSGAVDIHTIRTPAGNTIEMYDASGAEKIVIKDAKGITTITLDSAGKLMDIKTSGDLTIKADGKVNIEGTGGVTVKSGATLDLEGTGASKLQTGAALTIKGSTVAIN
jgi:Rhs element Vgr protein